MGLTRNAVGIGAIDSGLIIRKQSEDDRVIALAGNPNVGKSTVFNSLTGMNQHTGNWPGKTVTNAQGYCKSRRNQYVMVDIPGTYSLFAHSTEEEVARNFICFGDPDAVVVVCDATCLERNLNLVLQTIEISPNVVVCVNLMDEAKRKHISIDLKQISRLLGVPVVGTIARKRSTLDSLLTAIDGVVENTRSTAPTLVTYPREIEDAISTIAPVIDELVSGRISSRWLSLRLLDSDESLVNEISAYFGESFLHDERLQKTIEKVRTTLLEHGVSSDKLKDMIVSSIVKKAQSICECSVTYASSAYNKRDRQIDSFLTSKWTGYPVMLILLCLIFYLTITVANYPSELIAKGLAWVQDRLSELFVALGSPQWLHDVVVLGIYHVLAWVVSVMLPPMAIFFPMFTLLEDVGYLPRIAYNLDKPFRMCNACGKQALTMCMGFGCNAAGIVGCRIIDSPREKLLAILTNNFVPCNGRFPTLIAIISMFFVGTACGFFPSLLSAVILTCVIVLGIAMTFFSTKLLSSTILKGVPSSFTLELPPYRKPQIGKVIVRSLLDRTLFVLARAVAVAAPAGLIIWIAANVSVGDASILSHCADFFDPFARLMGLDGVILIAFVFGLPANEIVVPIIIMAYMAQGSLLELDSIAQMRDLFIANGWTWVTAVCTMLFSLMHWPCTTALLTIKNETGSIKWTAVAFLLPTLFGILSCMLVSGMARLFGIG